MSIFIPYELVNILNHLGKNITKLQKISINFIRNVIRMSLVHMNEVYKFNFSALNYRLSDFYACVCKLNSLIPLLLASQVTNQFYNL